ncbi:hypothetical protein BFW01_g12769 [Lasiodiplodia theobromae]|nr:hypothetical protein BFW01_g12769 [Lasiodiplodia theobromae]
MPVSPSTGRTALVELCEAANPQNSTSQHHVLTLADQSLVTAADEYQQLVERNRAEELDLFSRHRKEEAQCYERIHLRQNTHDACAQPKPNLTAPETVIIDLGSDSEEEYEPAEKAISPQHALPAIDRSEIRAKKYYIRRPQSEGTPWSCSEEKWEGMPAKRKETLSNVGWVMETDAGKNVSPACRYCEKFGYECRVLAKPLIGKDGVTQPRCCTYCFLDSIRCSLLDRPIPQRDVPDLEMPDVEMSDVHTPLKPGGSGSRGNSISELTTLLSTPIDGGSAELQTLTDMFKKEEPEMEPVQKRSPTAITNSRSSNAKKLRRVSFIDLTDS